MIAILRCHQSVRARGCALVAAAAATGCVAPEPEAAARAVPRTYVYDCADGVSFTVRTGADEVALWTPDELGGDYFVLGAVRSASGARYADGDTEFWNRGDVATFEIDGQRFVDCRSNPSPVP